MDRRTFLKQIGLISLGYVLSQAEGWAMSAPLSQSADRKKLVVVFLRGAVDGLSVVYPAADRRYYDYRPNIAIPEPGQANGGYALDNHYALHPALSALYPYWKQGHLAFVHACGSPDPSRSHFDAQDYMESGTPGQKSTKDGWMNRLLQIQNDGDTSPLRAINMGPTIPRILSGRASVANIAVGNRGNQSMLIDAPRVKSAFDNLYGGNDALGQAYREGQQAHRQVVADFDREMQQANNGSPLPGQFAATAQKMAVIVHENPATELAFVGLGGWDTHVNQGNHAGQLARNLQNLGDGLAEFIHAIGPAEFNNTVIVVMSEFGRTVRENGNAGTDHGHGNVMWLLGGGVKGGRIYNPIPDLSANTLYENRDLPVNLDFRSVMSTVLTHHLDISPQQLAMVFPDFNGPRNPALAVF